MDLVSGSLPAAGLLRGRAEDDDSERLGDIDFIPVAQKRVDELLLRGGRNVGRPSDEECAAVGPFILKHQMSSRDLCSMCAVFCCFLAFGKVSLHCALSIFNGKLAYNLIEIAICVC